MIGYLLALLLAASLAFTTLGDGTGGVVWRGSPALGGWVGLIGAVVVLVARRRGTVLRVPLHGRIGPGFWPLAGLAAGRWLSALYHGAGYSWAFIATTGPLAYLALAGQRDRVPDLLRRFGLVLLPVQAAMLIAGYFISSNLMAHLLMICWCAWHPRIFRAERRSQDTLAWLAMGAALASTASKGAAAGAVVGLCLYAGMGWVAIPAAPVAAGLAWLARPWASMRWRLACWASAWERAGANVMIGAGPGSMAMDHHMAVHAHNLALNVLLWDGVLGLMLLGIGAGIIWLERRRWPAWAAAGLAGMLIHYLVDDFTGCALCLVLSAALLAASNPLLVAQTGGSNSHN